MFGEVETVYLEPKTAVDFGIIKGYSPSRKKAYSFQPISIEEEGGMIFIGGKVDDVETTLKYEKEKLTPKQNAFIAWVYLLLRKYDTQDNSKEMASEYLKEALKDDLERPRKMTIDERWAFPYYLISNNSLDVSGVVDVHAELYKFLKRQKPLFLDFYKEILRREHNPIRKVAVARLAEKHYPTESWFIDVLADDLFDQYKYDECIAYLLSVKKRSRDKRVWAEMGDVRLTLWKCYIKKHRYKDALGELDTPLCGNAFNEDYTSLLRGVVFTYQGKWQDAITHFEEVVVEDVRDTNLSTFASYYLVQCFLATKNIVKAEQVVSAFRLREDELFLYGIPFHYGEDAIDILTKALKSRALSEKTLAKLKGMLAFVLYKMLPAKEEGGSAKKQNQKEKANMDRAIKLVKGALEFYPDEVFFNALYSNLLDDKKLYDEAMTYKLKSLIRDAKWEAIYANAELSNCSDEYFKNYPKKVVEVFSGFDITPQPYIESYSFDSDMGALWKRKLYGDIAELFLYVKPYIKDYEKIGELGPHLGGVGLFEIAYSLSEAGNKEEAVSVYEKHLALDGDNSSALNNLAILYEKKGELKKARKLISKAKSLDKNGELVKRNYDRIYGNKSDENPLKPREEIATSKRKKGKLSFDLQTGEISLGTNKCTIPPASNQYQLCKALFAIPFGQWLDETDVVDSFFRGKESSRSFYDATRLTNQKIEQGLKIRKLLVYDASRVQIRTDGLG